MKHLKKSILGLSLLVLSLSACGPSNSSEDTNDDEDVDITLASDYEAELSILIPNSTKREETMVDAVIQEFNLKYPKISVVKKFVNVDGWENTVRNQNIAGILPDIVWSNSPDYYFLIDSKIGLNLAPYIRASEANGDFDFKSDFYTEYFDMGAKDGKYYCIPRSCDSVVTFYNKNLLSAAGIDTSDIVNGWTWETFLSKLEAYRQYLDKNGQKTAYCVDMNLYNWLSVPWPILNSYGGTIIDKDLNVTVDSPETRECLSMIREMVEKRYIPVPGVETTNSFEFGTSPFLFQSSSISLFADTALLKGKIDIASFPLIQDKGTPKIGCGIAGYAINSKTKHKVACWQFLNTMISYDGQQAMATGGLNLPSVRKDLQTIGEANWTKGYEHLNLSAYTYGSEYKITPDFLSWPDPRAKAGLVTATTDLFYNASRDDKDIEYAIRVCKDEVQDIMDSVRR